MQKGPEKLWLNLPTEGQSSNSQILCITCTARPRLPKNYKSHWNASTKLRMLPGHRAANCPPKGENGAEAGESTSGEYVDENWCLIESMFHSFRAVDNGEKLYMGNSVTADIKGEGDKIGRSSKIDDEVVQDQRQRDDNDLQDERQDQPKEEEVEPRRCKRARIKKSFRPDFVSFMVENEPTSYREVVTSSEWLNGMKPLKVK
ncbi:hypothetical protein Tco_0381723 [Tanacetum coccineum]